ncbi:MAG: hypothetical protein PHW76_09505, partial [Alphaproteobacteria bacterium]|nr:hypothetical protein [Alphaproteobacteria bacterium]
MAIDTLARIIDAQSTSEGCKVTYAVEDQQTRCFWRGDSPKLGEIYLISPESPGEKALRVSSPSPGCWKPNGDALRWRKPISPENKITRMEVLRRRQKIRCALRKTLDDEGFLEVDVPLLVHGAPPEISIDSFKIEDRYLITSSEYQLRRLAVGGFTRTYSLTKNFRQGDNSAVRNPEFTMLEWGRIGGTMKEIECDTEKMVANALESLKRSVKISYRGNELNLSAPWDRIPVLEAIERFTGIAMKDFEAASCRRAIQAAGLEINPDWAENRGFLFSLLM